MKLRDILDAIKEKKGADLYVDFDFGGTTHFVQIIKAPFVVMLKREFTDDEETGKNIYYNETYDSLYIESSGKETGTHGKQEAGLHASDPDQLRKNRSMSTRHDHSGRTRLVLNGRGSIGQDRGAPQV